MVRVKPNYPEAYLRSPVPPDHVRLQENLRAPSQMYGREVLRQNDPYALTVSVNELCYALRPEVRDLTRAFYWVSWIIALARETSGEATLPSATAARKEALTLAASSTPGGTRWVSKSSKMGMKIKALCFEKFILILKTILIIAQNGMTQLLEVNSDLVGSTGL